MYTHFREKLYRRLGLLNYWFNITHWIWFARLKVINIFHFFSIKRISSSCFIYDSTWNQKILNWEGKMWGMILLGFSLSNWVYVCARARVLFIFRWLYIKKTLIQMLHASMIMNDKTSWHVFLLAWMIHKWIIWNFISFILRIKLWSWGFILMLVVFIIIFMIMLKKKCVSNLMHLDQTSLSLTHTHK
jgi:hypothetical protein